MGRRSRADGGRAGIRSQTVKVDGVYKWHGRRDKKKRWHQGRMEDLEIRSGAEFVRWSMDKGFISR